MREWGREGRGRRGEGGREGRGRRGAGSGEERSVGRSREGTRGP